MKVDLIKVLQKLMAVHNVSVNKYEYPYNFDNVDMGLRKIFEPDFNWNTFISTFAVGFAVNKLYIIEDVFGVFYTTFIIKAKHPIIMVVGPYLHTGKSFEAKHYIEKGFTSKETEVIKDYVLKLPHIHEDVITQQMAAVMSAAVEEEIEIKNIREHRTKGKNDNFSFVYPQNIEKSSMSKLEYRYSLENEILQAVAMGNLTKAREAFRKMTGEDVAQRYIPSVAAQKKSLMIMNTLFRKTIERAGVHPYYIDEISYRFFQKIDLVNGRKEYARMLDEMMVEYCEYAKKYSVEQYSPIVQKAINVIHLNLATAISLKDIADILEITPNHLARLFNAETGKTVVDYINHTRVKIAANKLKQTTNTVAEIAESVGIPDTNYFSRIFRRYMGCSPTEYRK